MSSTGHPNCRRTDENLLKLLSEDKSIRNVDDVYNYLERNKPNQKSQYEKSEALQLKATLKSVRWLREESVDGKNWNVYDQGPDTDEIWAEWGMKKREVAKLLTPSAKEAFKRIDQLDKLSEKRQQTMIEVLDAFIEQQGIEEVTRRENQLTTQAN